MAGSINGIACDFAKGYVQGARQTVYRWQVPGIDGEGRQRLGTQPTNTPITLIKFGIESNVRAWYRSIEDLQTTSDPVSYVNDQGDSTQVFVEQVSELQLSAAVGATSNLADVRGQIEITVRGAV